MIAQFLHCGYEDHVVKSDWDQFVCPSFSESFELKSKIDIYLNRDSMFFQVTCSI